MEWFVEAMRKYAVFKGRARRKEYWWFLLVYILVSVVLTVLDGIIGQYDAQSGMGLLSGLFALGTFLPALAVAVRRLHDTDRSGWWVLITLVPLVGLLVFVFFMARSGTAGDNRFGTDPKAAVVL